MNDKIKIGLLITIAVLMAVNILIMLLKPKEKETYVIDLGSSRATYFEHLARTKDEIFQDVVTSHLPDKREQDRVISEYWKRMQRLSGTLPSDSLQSDTARSRAGARTR